MNTVTVHEFDGEKYRQASAHQKEWGGKLIDSLELTGRERILDLGCGDGELTAQLADRVPAGAVLGIDSSTGMIATATRRQARPNLRFRLLDMRQLPFDAKFDLVFSNAALHWVRDHADLLRRVLAALRPGGLARFNFPAAGNCATFNRVVQTVMAEDRFAESFRSFEWPWFMPTLQEYQGLARELPFREPRLWTENADRFFPDPNTMVRWIDQPCLVPFLPRLPESDRAAFRTELIARMVQATRQPDGRCFEQFRRLQFAGRK